MLAFRWFFEVLLLVSNVGRTILTKEGQQVSLSQELTQTEAEVILNVQTSLRKYLIKSLTDVREKITQVGYNEVVDDIIKGLQTRALDPFTAFTEDNNNLQGQSLSSQMAEIIYNLQGTRGFTISDWNSLLETIPIHSHPIVQQIPEHLRNKSPIVDFVLTEIQKKSLTLNGRLLGDILYNYRFENYSPECHVILENINKKISESSLNFSKIHFYNERPDEILSAILKFVSQNENPEFVYQINLLLSLSSEETIVKKDELWRLFDLIQPDDYPADIIETKNSLSLELKNNQTGFNLSEIAETIKDHPPQEKLLMLITHLTSFSIDRIKTKAQALYPHVKMRNLSHLGKFFHPQTATDVEFLLDSFLTSPNKINPTLVSEIRRIFHLPDWENVLKNFDYSQYTKPRTLILDMVQGLLNNSTKLPVCCIILLEYFLRINRPDSCSSFVKSNDGFITSDNRHPEILPLHQLILSLKQHRLTVTTTPSDVITFESSNEQPLQTEQSEFDEVSYESTSSTPIETNSSTFLTIPDIITINTIQENTTETIERDSSADWMTTATSLATERQTFPPDDKIPSKFLTTGKSLTKPLLSSSFYYLKMISSSTPSEFGFSESSSPFSMTESSESQPFDDTEMELGTTSPIENLSTTQESSLAL